VDIRELDRRAVRASMDVVAQLRAEDLDRPTPCAGWTLADLLAHMTAQHQGFAAAAEGNGADLAVWRVEPVGDDAVIAYAKAAERVITAFAEDGVLDRRFALPEFGTGLTFPAAQAMGFHFIDYLVHGWDVARALGVEYTAEPDLAEAAWPIAQAVPNGEPRRMRGAAFQPWVAAPVGATHFDQILAMLGRPPAR
jgi:uncharacterized protein (TIGR03086 family)